MSGLEKDKVHWEGSEEFASLTRSLTWRARAGLRDGLKSSIRGSEGLSWSAHQLRGHFPQHRKCAHAAGLWRGQGGPGIAALTRGEIDDGAR